MDGRNPTHTTTTALPGMCTGRKLDLMSPSETGLEPKPLGIDVPSGPHPGITHLPNPGNCPSSATLVGLCSPNCWVPSLPTSPADPDFGATGQNRDQVPTTRVPAHSAATRQASRSPGPMTRAELPGPSRCGLQAGGSRLPKPPLRLAQPRKPEEPACGVAQDRPHMSHHDLQEAPGDT